MPYPLSTPPPCCCSPSRAAGGFAPPSQSRFQPARPAWPNPVDQFARQTGSVPPLSCPKGLVFQNAFINPDLQVRRKPDGQFGLFVKPNGRPIAPGEIVSILQGDFYTGAQLRRLPETVQRQSLQVADDIYSVQGPDKWGRYELDPTNYINHSCEPNTLLTGNDVLYARFPILPGQEITYDYGTSDAQGYPDVNWHCTCGTAACRGATRPWDYRWLVQKYGLNNVARYLKRRYLNETT